MIEQIENGIIAKIAATVHAKGYELKTLKTYGGEFSEGLERATRNFPAILLLYTGGPISEAGNQYKVTCRFLIVCAAGSLRNEKESRHGNADLEKIGSYQLVKDAILAVKNETLGLEIDEIKPLSVKPLVNDGAGTQLASVYGVEIETVFYTESIEDLHTLDAFITAHANWDIPPHGNVVGEDGELPADDTADATDHVTLPQ